MNAKGLLENKHWIISSTKLFEESAKLFKVEIETCIDWKNVKYFYYQGQYFITTYEEIQD